MTESQSFLPTRNALTDWSHVPSELMFEGSGEDGGIPLLSVTIPTFQRHGELAEAVASAIGQDLAQVFEVVVVDNDPDPDGHLRLREALPAVATARLRYYRNRKNLGMYGNVNRGLELSRCDWLSILHDDDMIDSDFARLMLDELTSDPRIDELVCRKRGLDQRPEQYRRALVPTLTRRALERYQFMGRRTRRIDARKLFFGCVIGNTVGFICRTRDVRTLGGFYPEEHPSSDYFFYARFAQKYFLAESRAVRATIRVGINSLIRKEQQLACLRRGYELQNAYVGTVLPRYWARLQPMIMARQVSATSQFWQSAMTKPSEASACAWAGTVRWPYTRYDCCCAVSDLRITI